MPDVPVHMRNSDAFSWYMERDPALRSTIVAVLGLDQSPDRERLTTRAHRFTRELPMFRQRVVEPPWRLATPRWVVDGGFDLSWHLRWQPLSSWDDVMELARRDAMTAFDTARPLWKVTVVDGLPDGQAAVVMKLHHSLTDGVGGMELALRLFDLEPHADEPPMPEPPTPEAVGALDLVREALAGDVRQVIGAGTRAIVRALPATVGALRSPVRSMRRATDLAASVLRTVQPVTHAGSPLMTDRQLGRHLATIEVPTASLRAAAKAAGGTINDAFMAAIAGGLVRYHDHHDVPLDRLRVTLPINIRTPEDPAGGNRITLQRVELPTTEPDVMARMRAIHDICHRAMAEPAVPHTDAIAGSLNLLPGAVTGSMLKHVDVVASNVPGFPFPVFLAGAPVRSYHAFGPTIGASLNVTLISYHETCFMGITIDTAAAPDVDVLIGCLQAGFDDVIEEAARRERARA